MKEYFLEKLLGPLKELEIHGELYFLMTQILSFPLFQHSHILALEKNYGPKEHYAIYVSQQYCTNCGEYNGSKKSSQPIDLRCRLCQESLQSYHLSVQAKHILTQTQLNKLSQKKNYELANYLRNL